jgi:hypothetical protein
MTMAAEKTSYKTDFRDLLAAYAALRWLEVQDGRSQPGDLLADAWMVRAIRDGLWTPPAAPKG